MSDTVKKRNGFFLDRIHWEADLSYLYKMMDSKEQHMFAAKMNHPSLQLFEEWLSAKLAGSFHDFFIIRSADSGDALGYVHNYDFSLEDGRCKLVTYIVPEHRDSATGALATVMFMDELFRRYPLNKFYLTVYGYNEDSVLCNERAGFEYEGELKDYRYYNGQTHSLKYYSVTREQFYKRLGRMI